MDAFVTPVHSCRLFDHSELVIMVMLLLLFQLLRSVAHGFLLLSPGWFIRALPFVPQ